MRECRCHEERVILLVDLETAEELYQRRITRIITTDFPQYFAVVTRIREESSYVGREGGMLSSTVVPQVQAQFPEGALTKQIKVGLQVRGDRTMWVIMVVEGNTTYNQCRLLGASLDALVVLSNRT